MLQKLNKNQIIAFWVIYTAFCVTMPILLNYFGIFEFTNNRGGPAFLTICFLVIGFFLHKYIASNPEKFED